MADAVATVAQVPADTVKAGAEEAKNALDLATKLIDSAEGEADTIIDEVSQHIQTALATVTDLLHLTTGENNSATNAHPTSVNWQQSSQTADEVAAPATDAAS